MPTTIVVDPICGMVVDPRSSAISCTYAGWTYLFCCQDCLARFQRAPETCVVYLAHSRSAHTGHLCRQQRKSWQSETQGDFR